MRQVTVEVTQEDIDKGQRGEVCSCAIALAVTRALGEPVVVGPQIDNLFTWAVFARRGASVSLTGRVIAKLPKEAREFAGRFDRMLEVEPFSFAVEVAE